MEAQRQTLENIYWIGGGTDAGKSTAARLLAARYNLTVYLYDRSDQAHIEQLAFNDPYYQAFLSQSLDERWVTPEAEALFQRLLRTFADRLPLVLGDLRGFPAGQGIVAEGFGFLPEMIVPLLSRPNQAVWLVPTDDFKRESMERRGKPSFAALVKDPQRARASLLERDRLLNALIRSQAQALGCRLIEVDGARSAEETAGELARYFGLSEASG